MGTKIINIYLWLLPFYLLSTIFLGTIRIAFQNNLAENVLIVSALMDLIIIITNKKKAANSVVFFIIIMLTLSCVVGLLNDNELSRRYITDFTNPLFFFAKIFIFAAYFDNTKFESFINYFRKVAFWGSIALLPLTYFLFRYAKASRIAIFPPMELPFSYFMSNNILFMMVSLIIIMLYGKRAQLIGAVMTFFIFIISFRKKSLVKYLIITLLCLGMLSYIFNEYKDNIAVRRFTYTFEQLEDSDNGNTAVVEIGGSRFTEVESIMKEMNGITDYVFGKGLGFQYNFQFNNTDNEKHSNAHFTPVSLLSKYGIIFTMFLYIFLFQFLKPRYKINDELKLRYITAWGTSIFIFFETFFSYAIFVSPIYPIVLGYLLSQQKNHEH